MIILCCFVFVLLYHTMLYSATVCYLTLFILNYIISFDILCSAYRKGFSHLISIHCTTRIYECILKLLH